MVSALLRLPGGRKLFVVVGKNPLSVMSRSWYKDAGEWFIAFHFIHAVYTPRGWRSPPCLQEHATHERPADRRSGTG